MAWADRLLRTAWWTGLAVLLLVPLVVALRADGSPGLAAPGPAPNVFITGLESLSLLTGVLALSLLVAATVLPSRLSWLNRAFGIERVLRGHRRVALYALALVLVHLFFVLAARPGDLRLLDPLTAPPRARAAQGATIALALLCGMAVWRRIRRQYTWWRIAHLAVALTVLILSGLHVFWLNHLIRDAAMRAVLTAMAVGLLLMLGYRWLVEPFRSRLRPYVVEEVRPENRDTSTLVLSPQHGYQPGLRFAPGQFAWIRLDRPFALREEHPFTIASGANDYRRLQFTIREAGDFTQRLRALEPGRVVYLDGPHGSFSTERKRGGGAVMIAAGVGITPMISMLRTFQQRGDPGQHVLIYAARTPQDLLFQAELDSLRATLRLQVITIVSQPPPDWTGMTGRIDQQVLASAIPERRHWHDRQVFVCGPGPMVLGTCAALHRLDVPAGRIHTELFDLGEGLPAPEPAPVPVPGAGSYSGDLIQSWTQAVTLLPRD